MYLFERIYPKLNLLDAGGAGGGSGGTSTGGDGTGGNANAGDTGGGGSPGVVDWGKMKASLPDDLKNEAMLEPIKDFTSLVKGYVSAQKMVGKDKISIPDAKHATEQDWVNVFQKLGAPQKVEDYKFKLPEGSNDKTFNEEFMSGIKDAAVKAGVMPWQFEKLLGAYYGHASKQISTNEEQYKTRVNEDVGSLKKEWGNAFDAQVKRANVAFKELIPNEADRQRLVDEGFGTNPVLLKALAKAADFFKEDVFLGHGDGVNAHVTPDDALKRAREIQGDAAHPYRNPAHPNHKTAKKEVGDLYKIAFPE